MPNRDYSEISIASALSHIHCNFQIGQNTNAANSTQRAPTTDDDSCEYECMFERATRKLTCVKRVAQSVGEKIRQRCVRVGEAGTARAEAIECCRVSAAQMQSTTHPAKLRAVVHSRASAGHV